MTYSVNDQIIIQPGWGYWDITEYPRGGCFCQAKVALSGVVTDINVAIQELYALLDDGRRVSVFHEAIRLA